MELLQNLVTARTVNPPGDEQIGAAVLKDFLSGHGLDVQTDEVEKGRPNLLCTVGQGTNRSLLFDSHLDVVSPGEPKSWRRDPFEPYVEDGKLFGRGACDDKASLPAMADQLGRRVRAYLELGYLMLAAALAQAVVLADDVRGISRSGTIPDIGCFEREIAGTGNRPLLRSEVGPLFDSGPAGTYLPDSFPAKKSAVPENR